MPSKPCTTFWMLSLTSSGLVLQCGHHCLFPLSLSAGDAFAKYNSGHQTATTTGTTVLPRLKRQSGENVFQFLAYQSGTFVLDSAMTLFLVRYALSSFLETTLHADTIISSLNDFVRCLSAPLWVHNEAAGPGGAGAKKPVAGEEEEELDAALAAADDADVGRSGRKDEVVFLYRPRPTVVLGNAWVCLSSSSTAFVL